MPAILFTGFPGFLGTALLPLVLDGHQGSRAVCIVQPRFKATARRRLAEIVWAHPSVEGRVALVTGDITRPGLGVADPVVFDDVAEAYHLAAVYDVDVPADVARRVNVEGTRHVLSVIHRCPRFERLHYVSTCYVSGRLSGLFREADLECGQTFNNHYEETKFEAERDVRAAMASGLPATIYRPGIVMGDSRTGATQKYDGPYFGIQLILRQPRAFSLLPVTGDASRVRMNVVPCDFVVNAIAYLARLDVSRGKTYHLANPAPPTVAELLAEIARATGHRVVRIRLPLAPTRWALARLPGMRSLIRIPPRALDYFTHPTTYDTTEASRDLAGSGIGLPPLGDYVDTLVAFMCAHPEIGAGAMA